MRRDNAAYSLVILPPKEDWGPFVEIKKNHMNPKIKRPPFPHITLLGSLNPDEIDLVGPLVSDCEPFDLEISSFKVFENKNNSTLYLDPKEDLNNNADNMRAIHRRLSDGGLRTRDFEPHIGIAFCDSVKQANALRDKYQNGFPVIRFRVTHVYVMKRNGETDPFEPFRAIALKGCENIKPKNEVVVK